MPQVKCSDCAQLALDSKSYCFYFDKEIKKVDVPRFCVGFLKK